MRPCCTSVPRLANFGMMTGTGPYEVENDFGELWYSFALHKFSKVVIWHTACLDTLATQHNQCECRTTKSECATHLLSRTLFRQKCFQVTQILSTPDSVTSSGLRSWTQDVEQVFRRCLSFFTSALLITYLFFGFRAVD